ncbi:MAG: hypothetical protein JWL64_904 [Frankiales bacterium]|nr:hypothetical protein [Frankiales bacterium]
MAALILWWALPMTRGSGGREAGLTAVALVLALVATAVVRPWRTVPTTVTVLSALVGVGSLVMCLVTPAGWSGADSAAAMTAGAVVLPVVLGYASTSRRRTALATAVCLAGAVEFLESCQAWWGGGDPTKIMVGTFYWWNPFAAFLLPGALLGVALAVRGPRPWRLAGWLATPLCLTGIVLSSSRTTLMLALAGVAALGVVVVGPGWRGALARWLAVLTLSAATLYLVSGPPFFEHRGTPGAAISQRTATGETLSQNGEMRLQFWERAIAVVKHHPLTGTGPHTLIAASNPHVDPTLAASNYAHSGFLQAFSDGGIVLGLPVLLGCLLAAAGLARRVGVALSKPAERWLALSTGAAGLGLLAHSGVDFDWIYPSDVLVGAIVVGLGLSVPVAHRERLPAPRVAGRLAVGSLALVAVVMSLAVARWDDTLPDIAAVSGPPAERAAELHAQGAGLLRDDRWARAVIALAAGGSGPISPSGVAAEDLSWAWGATERQAVVDPQLAVLRTRGLAALGRPDRALHDLQAIRSRQGVAPGNTFAADEAYLRAYGGVPVDRAELRRLVIADPDSAGTPDRLRALLLSGAPVEEIDRCLLDVVPSTRRLAGTPDPGPPAPATNCATQISGVVQ